MDAKQNVIILGLNDEVFKQLTFVYPALRVLFSKIHKTLSNSASFYNVTECTRYSKHIFLILFV